MAIEMTYDFLFSQELRCLEEFKTKQPEEKVTRKLNKDPQRTTRQVVCECGSEHFITFLSLYEERKSLFRRKPVYGEYAPVYAECAECKKRGMLFDPQYHGWDGEQGVACGIRGEDGVRQYPSYSVKVFVTCSYNELDEYQQLIDDGVSNPQDFFDWITIMVSKRGASSLEELIDYECA